MAARAALQVFDGSCCSWHLLASLGAASAVGSSFDGQSASRAAANLGQPRVAARVRMASPAATFDSRALVWLASVEALALAPDARSPAFVLGAQLVDLRGQIASGCVLPRPAAGRPRDARSSAVARLPSISRNLLLQVDRPHAHRGQLPAVAGDFLFQVATCGGARVRWTTRAPRSARDSERCGLAGPHLGCRRRRSVPSRAKAWASSVSACASQQHVLFAELPQFGFELFELRR